LGGVETGRQNAMLTATEQGIIKYIGFISNRSAMSHSNAANMVIVDEFDVTCVITLITNTHSNTIAGCETPEHLLVYT